ILGAIYMLWMFQRVMQGPLDKPENQTLRDLTLRERWVLLPIVVMMFVIGVMPNPFLNLFDQSSARILGRVRVASRPALGSGLSASRAGPANRAGEPISDTVFIRSRREPSAESRERRPEGAMIPVPPISDLQAIIPQILVSALAMIVLLADAMAPKANPRRLAVISVVGLLVAIGVSLVTRPENREPVLAGMVIADGYAHFFNILFMVSALLGVLLSVDYLEREGISHGEYYALLMLTTVGMMIMAAATDLIAIFLGLEVLSISLYVLAGYQRDKLISEESALKYFLLGAFASAFFLYGIALIYGATGATNLNAIVHAFPRAGEGGEWMLLLAGTALLIVGFGFKVAVVPFHVWTPDVYEGAPTSITAFMSVGAKAAGFAAFLRVFLAGLPSLSEQSAQILAILAALTRIIGNVVAISPRHLN